MSRTLRLLGRLTQIDTDSYEVHDLLTDTRYIWHGKRNYVALHPGVQPAHILRVRRL